MDAICIIQRKKDLGIFEFSCDADNWNDFQDIAKFHFEERMDPVKEHALFYKENYFKINSEDVWDFIELVEIH